MAALCLLSLQLVSAGAPSRSAAPSCFAVPTWNVSEVQVRSGITYGSAYNNLTRREEALTLDLYTPPADTRTRRPTFVLVHGGAFVGGSSTSDGEPDLARALATIETDANAALGHALAAALARPSLAGTANVFAARAEALIVDDEAAAAGTVEAAPLVADVDDDDSPGLGGRVAADELPSLAALYDAWALDAFLLPDLKEGDLGSRMRLPPDDTIAPFGVPANLVVTCLVPDYSPSFFEQRKDGRGWALVMCCRISPAARAQLRSGELSPALRLWREFVGAEPGDDWADRFRVAISFADGAPARVSTIHKSLRLYRPTCMYVWQLKTFWEQRVLSEDDVEVLPFEAAETVPATPTADDDASITRCRPTSPRRTPPARACTRGRQPPRAAPTDRTSRTSSSQPPPRPGTDRSAGW